MILVQKPQKLLCTLIIRLFFVKNLGLAGDNVTSDVSHGLQISIEAAEHAKIMYGSVVAPFNEKVELKLIQKEGN